MWYVILRQIIYSLIPGTTMNVLLGDSRVSYIKNSGQRFIKVEVEDLWSRAGGRLENCIDMVNDNIIYHHPPINPGKSHYYIMAGICDITTRITSKAQNYQEVIFNYNEDAISDVKKKINIVETKIMELGVLPIFCTVVPMHLETWNQTRFQQGKTSTLNYAQQYATMQSNLENALDEINHHIIKVNSKKNLATPLTHTSLLKRHKNGYYHLYGLLTDGCHPSEKAIEKLITSLSKAMSLNNDKH